MRISPKTYPHCKNGKPKMGKYSLSRTQVYNYQLIPKRMS